MTTKQQREARLRPNGIPRYIRCYDNGGVDNGGTIDRYTVVYTGRYQGSRTKNGYSGIYLGMSEDPFHGIGQHGESKDQPIDRPSGGHLGKRIKFTDLPKDCQTLVQSDYAVIWGLNGIQNNGISEPTVKA